MRSDGLIHVSLPHIKVVGQLILGTLFFWGLMDSVRTNTDRLAPPTTEDNLMSQVSDVGAGGAGGTGTMPPPTFEWEI